MSRREHSVVAIYETHAAAEAAVKALKLAGVDMKRLSIVGRDQHSHEQAVGFYSSGDRMMFWGGRGVFWGGLWGLLFGSALFFIPAVGPVVAMGPLVGWIVGALQTTAVGGATGVLAAALTSIGLPEGSVAKYEHDVMAGKFLVLARGTPEMIEQTRAALRTTAPSQLSAHVASLEFVLREEQRTDSITRASILMMLTDDEVGSVSTAQTAARLVDGEEYVDLGHLGQGVQRARGTSTPMGRVLPRKAVRETTWGRILKLLPLRAGQA